MADDLALIADAVRQGALSASAADNVRTWLREPCYVEFAPLVSEHIRAGHWPELNEAFWTVIPFGTAGRRGRMYPIGTNAINDRTIGESAQGLADYIRRLPFSPEVSRGNGNAQLRCAIAYDTRHRSRHFAELCAEVMAAAGFRVYFLDGHRATPALSFTVRHFQCACGIMVSASHNPPTDNAVKVFWSTGGQLKPPHDAAVIDCVKRVTTIDRLPFANAVSSGQANCCQGEVDSLYRDAVLAVSSPGPRDLKILYSPLHGVGLTSVLPVLEGDGFQQVEVYAPHAAPDGDFPNVPEHVANPENPAVFDALIAHAQNNGTELIVASDPDADRLGAAQPIAAGGPWRCFTGNQLAVLLAEYLLSRRQAAGRLRPSNYLVKTIVTTDMLARQAEAYGVRCFGEVLTGFKWIGGVIDEVGPDGFILGCEEAHGYLAGTHVRDKDGAVAAMLLAEYAAMVKAQGRTLHQELDSLFLRYGCHAERTVSHTLPGAEGMARMQAIMQQLRTSPPKSLAGMTVTGVRDYSQREPRGDVLVFELGGSGNRAAVRPSGTEPKIKFYLFAYEPPSATANLDAVKRLLNGRLVAMERDLLSAAR